MDSDTNLELGTAKNKALKSLKAVLRTVHDHIWPSRNCYCCFVKVLLAKSGSVLEALFHQYNEITTVGASELDSPSSVRGIS